MNKAKLAKSISYFFDPSVLWLLLAGIILFGGAISPDQRLLLAIPFTLFEVVLPTALFLYLLRVGKISDWEITNMRERRLLFIITTLSHLGSVAILFWLANPTIAIIRLVIWAIQVIATVITFYWKISIHLAGFTGFVLFLVTLYGDQWIWLLLIAPAIMWARVERKKHTWAQTVGGIMLSAACFWIYWIQV